MAGMFYDCTKLKGIKLSSPSNNLININCMFCNCINLTNVDLSLFDTKNLEYMGGLFDGCGKLANIDLSSFDTRNVKNMSYLFENCKNLTNI
jgi:surface protein